MLRVSAKNFLPSLTIAEENVGSTSRFSSFQIKPRSLFLMMFPTCLGDILFCFLPILRSKQMDSPVNRTRASFGLWEAALTFSGKVRARGVAPKEPSRKGLEEMSAFG